MLMTLSQQTSQMMELQLSLSESFRRNYADLQNILVKKIQVGDLQYTIQFNPGRIRSATAKTDAVSLTQRKCFLCQDNRPEDQLFLEIKDRYQLLVNPFPIFPRHLTIAESRHLPQRIDGRVDDMLYLSKQLTDYVIFYNGARCGASAPDHFHFQGGNKGFLPLEKDFITLKRRKISQEISVTENTACKCLIIESDDASLIKDYCKKVFTHPILDTDKKEEPMMNILCWWNDQNKWIFCIFPRSKHRPSYFFLDEENRFLVSPATVEMSGILVLARQTDFERMTSEILNDMLQQVSISDQQLTEIVESL